MEERNQRHLKLVVEGATNLAKKDIFGASDPYVIIYKEQDFTLFHSAVPYNFHPSNEIARTSTISRTLNPNWNESFNIVIEHGKLLILEVYDKNRITRDDFLGRAHLNPAFLASSGLTVGGKLTLCKRNERSRVSGRLQFSYSWVEDPLSDEESIYHADEEIAFSREITDLPCGWEEHHDNNGRIVYFHHESRTTQCTRPSLQAIRNRGSTEQLDENQPPTIIPNQSCQFRRIVSVEDENLYTENMGIDQLNEYGVIEDEYQNSSTPVRVINEVPEEDDDDELLNIDENE